ncbi:MAG: DUF4492 domain-containing protein [uncultured Sulfurovum sp.]|uniref:DUF4492 domain-containing protein n=1 Tax=uncultured Sulfurovum sp. TaxID=269237 RepID=A0A6S6U6G0_9BACT|nr:MAG: DUF4492 domain-containing protein [uncultured Sulfurovum sp.]
MKVDIYMVITDMDMNIITTIKKIFQFYLEGFKNMKIGKRLWAIIGIKFVIFFVIMKILFFPNFLKENFSTDSERAEHVLQSLTSHKE